MKKMKTKIAKKVLSLMVAGTLNTYLIHAQTALSGTGSNGCGASATGTDNTSIGCSAGASNAAGAIDNTFLGKNSGYSNSTGDYNTFTGFEAGKLSDIGSNNTFNGYQAGYSNAAHTYGGRDHVFVGYQAGYNSGNGDSEGTSVQNVLSDTNDK